MTTEEAAQEQSDLQQPRQPSTSRVKEGLKRRFPQDGGGNYPVVTFRDGVEVITVDGQEVEVITVDPGAVDVRVLGDENDNEDHSSTEQRSTRSQDSLQGASRATDGPLEVRDDNKVQQRQQQRKLFQSPTGTGMTFGKSKGKSVYKQRFKFATL